jgi:putative phosphoesterase
MRIGLISDTHGLLRPQALAALTGCERIIHAGDIGSPEVLHGLADIAPVTAVRGNNDRGPWALDLPETMRLKLEGVSIYVLHDLRWLAIDPVAEGHAVVVAGHSHRPDYSWRNGVLMINPGSAGPRRFKLPVSIGMLQVVGGNVTPELTTLDV